MLGSWRPRSGEVGPWWPEACGYSYPKRLAANAPGGIIDLLPYGLHSIDMARKNRQIHTMGAEDARKQLPSLVTAAAGGRTTIITKHGRAIAAVVPVEALSPVK